MSEWKESKLGEVATIVDCEHKTAPLVDFSEYISVRTANISNGRIDFDNSNRVSKETFEEWTKRMEPAEGDIILAREAPVGEVGWVTENRKVCLGQRTVLVRVNSNAIDPKYLLYYLVSDDVKYDLISRSTGSVVEHLNVKDIKDFDLKVHADIKDQQAISSILTSLDDKIALLHRQNKTLEALAETLFRQWFMEEAEGKERRQLDELVLFDPREKIDRQREYQFFEMKCLSNTDMNIEEGINRIVSSASTFRNNDTLLAKITPCLENGKTGFVMQLNEDEVARGSTEFIVMRSKGLVSPYWIYCLARSNDFRDSAILSMTGTSGRQRVQIDLLKDYEVWVDEGMMAEFHKQVDPYFKKIKSNQTQTRTLTQLRDTLLLKLMSGEVEVKN